MDENRQNISKVRHDKSVGYGGYDVVREDVADVVEEIDPVV